MADTIRIETALASIQEFLADKLTQTGLTGYVIGLSGGIDSAVAATLAAASVGPAKLYGIMMPFRTSSESSRSDAIALAKQLGIDFQVIDISPMIDAYYDQIDDDMRLRAGNKMARERMSILFDIAHKMNRLVLGTGNRTEICLGYTTWYGDSACSVNPIGQLYKTDVRKLAKLLDVPDAIISKSPSADLWQGQTDEDEIGITYEKIDLILRKIIDKSERSLLALESNGLDPSHIQQVVAHLNRNSFKRSLPEIAPLGRIAIPNKIQLSR